jgi:hypothetical protein
MLRRVRKPLPHSPRRVMMVRHRTVSLRLRSVTDWGSVMAEHDHSGDHGIDIDDMRIALSTPARRPQRRPVLGTFGPAGRSDLDSDFGYDQAHEG